MPCHAITKQNGLSLAGLNTSGSPRGQLPTFFYDTQGRGIPRFEDMVTIRALERTHTVSIPLDTIKEQIATTPWTFRPTIEKPTSRHHEACDMAEAYFDGRFNQNREPFDHLVRQWVHDILSIDSGILELVPQAGGDKLSEVYSRDGATFVKAPDTNDRLPAPGSGDPAYFQFPLTRRSGFIREDRDEPLREFTEAYEGLNAYGHLFKKPVPFARNELVWAEQSPVPWSPYGQGRVQKAKRVIEIVIHQDITNKRHFTANEIPEGVLNVIDGSRNEVDRFREYWMDEVAGREHKMAILGGREFKWVPFREGLKDLQFLESQAWYHKLVWILFGLNQNEVGDLADVNRSTAQEQSLTVWRRTTKPLLDMVASLINRNILPYTEEYEYGRGEIEFCWEPDNPEVKRMLRARQKEDIETGTRTINEVRRERGEEELAWGDMPLELIRSLSRSNPEWAVEAWGVLDEGVDPPPPSAGFGQLDARPSGVKDLNVPSLPENPYGAEVPVVREPLREDDPAGFPPLAEHAGELAKRIGKVFLEAGDDLVRQVERVMEHPEAGAPAKQPTREPPADRLVEELDLARVLGDVVAEANREAVRAGAEFHAREVEEALREQAGEAEAEFSISFDVEDTLAMRQMEERAAARMTTVEQTVKEAIRRTIVQNFREGGNVQTLTKALRSQFSELSSSHARLVARTETLTASRHGSQALIESTEVIGGKRWIATRDHRTRPWHRAMHDTVVEKGEPFVVPSGWEGPPDYQPKSYPKSVQIVGEDQPYNCFLPGTEVQGSFTGALETRYDGPARELVSASGQRLRVTPNHPILTSEGWVPAGEIAPGDRLVRYSGPVDGDAGWSAEDDDQHGPAPIEEVADMFLSEAGERALALPGDLHGDAEFGDGEIHVASLPCELEHGLDAPVTEQAREATLTGSDVGLAPLPGAGPLTPDVDGIGAAAAGGPSTGEVLLGGLLPLRPGQALCLGLAPEVHASLPEAPGEGLPGDRRFLRQLVEGLASVVAFDEVVEVREFHFSGQVYDLQTLQGAYVADGMFVHNCRCAHSPVLARDLPEDLTTLALHPDITVTGVPPDLGSAPGPRAREVMQDRAVAAETFEHWVKREYETADGSHSRLRDNLGVGKATAYDWTGRAGITA